MVRLSRAGSQDVTNVSRNLRKSSCTYNHGILSGRLHWETESLNLPNEASVAPFTKSFEVIQ